MHVVLGILSLLWKLHIGVVFLLTAIFFYPIITPLLFFEKGKKASFTLFVVWSWFVRILCLYHVRKINSFPIPDEPAIIIANHASYLDIFLLYSILPNHPFLFLGKGEILKYPLIKTYFKRLNIPVFRNDVSKAARSFVKAAREVKNGWSLVIFPEGGIPDDNNPKMIEFKTGAFKLAKNVQIPIVPITFLNNYKLFSDPTNLLGPARPGICKVEIHETIPADNVRNLSADELKTMCFNIIEKSLKSNKAYQAK